MHSTFLHRTVIAAALFSIAACSDDTTAPTPIPSASLSIAAPAATVYEADAVVLTAVYRDVNGAVVPNAPVAWSVDDTLRAQLGANGYVLALKSGVAKISAKSGGINATYDLVITHAPVLSVIVSPTTPVLTRGDVGLIGVKTEGPGGRLVTGRLVTLASDNPAVAVIDASGRVRAVASGVATVRATSENVVGTALVQVRDGTTELNLTHKDGLRLPILVDADSVWYEGAREFHEVYLETGKLTLTGSPQLRYQVEARFMQYNVTTVNGQRRMELRYVQKEADYGIVAYDARGDMQLTSEFVAPLHHVIVPMSGGMQMQYRIAGTDDVLQLFFRREPQ